MSSHGSECIEYLIREIDLKKETVTVESSVPAEELRGTRPFLHLFPEHPITIDRVATSSKSGTVYTLSFQALEPEESYPSVYPLWTQDTLALPLWSLIATPQPRLNPLVSVRMESKSAPTGSAALICPADPKPLDEMVDFHLVGGYETSSFQHEGASVVLYAARNQDYKLLEMLTKSVLDVHRRFFGKWLWDEIHMVFDEQRTRLKKQKAVLASSGSLALGRYVLQTLRPGSEEELCRFLDIVEHEILHYYIDTSAPAGSWFVEGLTTYLSNKLLFESGLITEKAWTSLVIDAQEECDRNQLCHKISLNQATERFWEVVYGNVVYNKGFLVSCLLDQELDGRLLSLARELFEEYGAYRRPFSEAAFLNKLPDHARSRLQHWLNRKDLSTDFNLVRGFRYEAT